jgi:hypothetical protein
MEVIDAVKALHDHVLDSTIVFLTGREGTEANILGTKAWLNKYFPTHNRELYSRLEGDHRADYVIKYEIVKQVLSESDCHVIAVFDDRPQVIQNLWIPQGFGDRLFNVGTHRWIDNFHQNQQQKHQELGGEIIAR